MLTSLPDHTHYMKNFHAPAGNWLTMEMSGLAMVAVDFYFLIVIGRVDRTMVEKQLDQAEFWPIARPFARRFRRARARAAERRRRRHRPGSS